MRNSILDKSVINLEGNEIHGSKRHITFDLIYII